MTADAGFVDVTTGRQSVVWEFVSRDECTRFVRDVAPPVTALVADRAPQVQERVWQRVTDEAWEPFAAPDGRVRVVNEAFWVAAVAPA